ncbi:hypothetical protein DMC47_22365 [Nostoc sp. 3335mG]|nr:hypothetical protein DMC47_22365 [Nostoc sp. 3335mG]
MTWEYLIVDAEGGMIDLKPAMGTEHRQSLADGLGYLGSQRWELVTTMPKTTLGSTTGITFFFKRPQD